jgi:hypothetical protein
MTSPCCSGAGQREGASDAHARSAPPLFWLPAASAGTPMPWMGTAPAQVPGVEERFLLHQRCDIADASMPQGQEDLCR